MTQNAESVLANGDGDGAPMANGANNITIATNLNITSDKLSQNRASWCFGFGRHAYERDAKIMDQKTPAALRLHGGVEHARGHDVLELSAECDRACGTPTSVHRL